MALKANAMMAIKDPQKSMMFVPIPAPSSLDGYTTRSIEFGFSKFDAASRMLWDGKSKVK